MSEARGQLEEVNSLPSTMWVLGSNSGCRQAWQQVSACWAISPALIYIIFNIWSGTWSIYCLLSPFSSLRPSVSHTHRKLSVSKMLHARAWQIVYCQRASLRELTPETPEGHTRAFTDSSTTQTRAPRGPTGLSKAVSLLSAKHCPRTGQCWRYF